MERPVKPRRHADQFYTLYEQGYTNQEIADLFNCSVSGVRGGRSEYKKYLQWQSFASTTNLNSYSDIQNRLPIRQLDDPIRYTGDCIIIGDVQLPTTDYEFAKRPLMIAQLYLSKPRTCIIAGDLINADVFSSYDDDIPSVKFADELRSARRFLQDYLSVFDRIIWFMGNHERRATRRTKGAITPQILADMVMQDDRITVSDWGHCIVDTPKGEFRITHQKNYSIQQLNVADQLAQKYRQHIISHHEHHFAQGKDRFGHHILVNNGGLFNQDDMSYVVLDDSKHANMKLGFTLLQDGYVTLYGDDDWTNWDAILSQWAARVA